MKQDGQSVHTLAGSWVQHKEAWGKGTKTKKAIQATKKLINAGGKRKAG